MAYPLSVGDAPKNISSQLQYIFGRLQKKLKDNNLNAYLVSIFFFVIVVYANIKLSPFEEFHEIPFILSFLAVVVAAFLGGLSVGIFATILLSIATNYVFINNNYWNENSFFGSSNGLRMISLIIEGSFVSFLIGNLKTARENAVKKTEVSIKDVKYLRDILDNLFVFVGVITPDGTLVETNKASIEASNISFDEVIGKPIDKTYWWSFSKESRRILRKSIVHARKISSIRYDTHMRVADGKLIAVDFSIAPIRDKNQMVEYLVLSAVDVNARTETLKENIRLYREIKKQKRTTDNIISQIPGVVWELVKKNNRNGLALRFVSSYEETMLGHKIGTCVNDPDFWKKVIYKDDLVRVMKEVNLVYKNQKPKTTQFRCLTSGNRLIWVESRFVANTDEEGNSVGVEGVMTDISDRIKLEQTKDEFISIASHEIKTPLTTIKAFAQIVQKRSKRLKDEESLKYLDKMNLYINKLSQIINDFMDFSKIESGKLEYYKEEFNIGQMIQETVDDMQTIVESHRILVKNIVDQDIVGDKNRISQVLINLISNAVKYSPGGDLVTVNMDYFDDKVVIGVTDQGIGIPKDSQKNIFNKFYRVKYPKRKNIEGFGIGLYISSEIIKRHNGKIWVESEENNGSTFYFSLPTKTDVYEK